LYRKLRKRDTTKFHIQLCIALFCMLIVFVAGIDKTGVYGGCVTASALIHYFTLVAVMWMGAEAVLMFQKLIIVFHQTTTKFIVVVSLICWGKCKTSFIIRLTQKFVVLKLIPWKVSTYAIIMLVVRCGSYKN